jgi:hypothetical protein
MIAGIFHQGSGLGNQLHRYVATRCLALDKFNYFGMISPENFKGHSFMNLNMGVPVRNLIDEFHEEKFVNEFGHDVRSYDPKIQDVLDFTLIDGEFQDPKYFMHRIDLIDGWLQVEPPVLHVDTCIIGFRGGEYVGVKDLFLPKEYWDMAIDMMLKENPNMKFEVHTDDVITAKQFFPDFGCIHDISLNWRSVRYANYLIIANSSFYILPSLLNGNVKKIIAPKYWAGYNKGYWQLPQNTYSKFTYIHHNEN